MVWVRVVTAGKRVDEGVGRGAPWSAQPKEPFRKPVGMPSHLPLEFHNDDRRVIVVGAMIGIGAGIVVEICVRVGVGHWIDPPPPPPQGVKIVHLPVQGS